MSAAHALIAASAAIPGLLGTLHLVFTFHGNKLHPRDPAVRQAMEQGRLTITGQTSVWRALKGFNATHSLGLMLFGLVWGYLALWRPAVLDDSPFLMGLGMAVLLAYLALSLRYFFSTPVRGMALACALYAGGWLLV